MKKLNYKSILIPISVGILLYFINSNLLKYLFNTFPVILTLTFGRGTWWLYSPWYVQIFYVGIFAPVFEEYVFRNIIFKWFLKKNYFLIGLLISSVIFGFWHMVSGWGILKAVNMIFVGIVFGLIYKKYNLKGSLICHFTNNCLSLLFLLVLNG